MICGWLVTSSGDVLRSDGNSSVTPMAFRRVLKVADSKGFVRRSALFAFDS